MKQLALSHMLQEADPPSYGTYKDGSDLLSDELGWGGNVIVPQEMNIVLDIHNSQRKTDTDTERAVVVHIDDGELITDDARSLCERSSLGRRGEGQSRRRCLRCQRRGGDAGAVRRRSGGESGG